MVIKQDCPKCGRKGNDGHVDLTSDDKGVIALETTIGGIADFIFGGPVGAAAGAAVMNKAFNWAGKKFNTDKSGYVWYRFNCMNPDCKHTWISKIKE